MPLRAAANGWAGCSTDELVVRSAADINLRNKMETKMTLIAEKIPKIYLSRRNLLTLLSKLDREAKGELTACAIVKIRSASAEFRQTMERVMVIAVDDEVYYPAQNRPAGEMHPADEEGLPKPSTGLTFWETDL